MPDLHAVYLKKTEVMKRLVYLVSHGYTRYAEGSVEPEKAEALATRFEDRYAIGRDTMQRYRARKKGQANSMLVMWPESETSIRWWLLVTEGTSLVTQVEPLKHYTASKIQLTGYELVKLPRPGKEHDLTWRMTKATFQDWQDRLVKAVKHRRDDLLDQCIHSLRRLPGFSQVRKQAFELVKLAEGHWRKVHGNSVPFPHKFNLGWAGTHQKPQTADVRDIKPRRKRRPPVAVAGA